jgi:hypothetical protein
MAGFLAAAGFSLCAALAYKVRQSLRWLGTSTQIVLLQMLKAGCGDLTPANAACP